LPKRVNKKEKLGPAREMGKIPNPKSRTGFPSAPDHIKPLLGKAQKILPYKNLLAGIGPLLEKNPRGGKDTPRVKSPLI